MAEGHKYDNYAGGLDSFEVNMKQIDQTNKLLANIETKLTDFFKKNDTKPGKVTMTFEDEQQEYPDRDNYQPSYQIEREQIVGGIDPQQYGQLPKFSSEKPEVRPSSLIHVIDTSNPEHSPSKPNYSQISREQFYNRSPHRFSESTLLGSKTFFSDRDKVKIEENFSDTQPLSMVNLGEMSGTPGLVDKMNKLEEFYQSKIRLLEERILNGDREVQTLIKLNENLNSELARSKKENHDSRSYFLEELTRALRDQEERMRRDFESSLRVKDRMIEENQKQCELYLETLDELKIERSKAIEDSSHYKNLHQMVLDEKEQLHRQYQNLLNIHNQMLQLDIQKNEKNLKESMTSMDTRSSAARQAADDHVRHLVDSLGTYKQELEYLKENNNLIQKQFNFEIQRLKEELRSKHEENERLQQKVSKEKAKNRNTSPRYPSHSAENPENIPFLGEEDINQLDKNELAFYARKIRDSYLDLEERHRQQLLYNKTLQTNLRDLSARNKEEVEKLNDAYQNIYESDRVSPGTLKSHEWNPHAGASPVMPFTNSQIKTTLMTTKEKRDRLREALDKDLGRIPITPEDTTSHRRSKSRGSKRKELERSAEKSRERSHERTAHERSHERTAYERSHERTAHERAHERANERSNERAGGYRKSKGNKSFEDFGEELQKLKAIVNSKLKSGKKTQRSTISGVKPSKKAHSKQRSKSSSRK